MRVNPLSADDLLANPSVDMGKTPITLAEDLRTCIAQHHDDMPAFNRSSQWAGRVIEADGFGLIVGPLIPKVASTDLRDALGVKDWKNHPSEFRTLHDTLHLRGARESVESKLWFAVVRNPVSKLISGYAQVAQSKFFGRDFASRYPECDTGLYHFEDGFSPRKVQHAFPERFCSLSEECQEKHFQKLFAPRNELTQYEVEHRISQMNWLAQAADHIQAIVSFKWSVSLPGRGQSA